MAGSSKRARLDLRRQSFMSDPDEDEEDSLRLTLGPPGSSSRLSSSQDLFLRTSALQQQGSLLPAVSTHSEEDEHYRPRRTPVRTMPPGAICSTGERLSANSGNSAKKGPHVPAPFPWSTEYRAKNHSLEWILRRGLTSIGGEVQCKRCDGMTTVEVNLQAAFVQLERYFIENKHSMHDRAPKHWMVPRLLDCTLCHQNDCVKPIIAEKKREINWLFLLLTQTLGLCTLDQLKFFCKHNDKHRTGAKDRVLYSTYGGLLKQLNPAGKYLPND